MKEGRKERSDASGYSLAEGPPSPPFRTASLKTRLFTKNQCFLAMSLASLRWGPVRKPSSKQSDRALETLPRSVPFGSVASEPPLRSSSSPSPFFAPFFHSKFAPPVLSRRSTSPSPRIQFKFSSSLPSHRPQRVGQSRPQARRGLKSGYGSWAGRDTLRNYERLEYMLITVSATTRRMEAGFLSDRNSEKF